jgi:elongation factor G
VKQYPIENIRNVALVGHGGSGKTTLVEHLLYLAGHIDRIGTVEAGNTVSDFDQEETRRKISLSISLLPLEWQDHKVNMLDVPGFPDFIGEMYGSLRVADTALLVAPAQAELEVGFENAWELCEQYNLPRFIFINKMERDNADHTGLIQTLQQIYGRQRVVPIQVPIGTQTGFKGVVDVVHMAAYLGSDRDTQQVEIPAELMSEAQAARDLLMEAAAESDDDLAMKYLDGELLTDEEIVHGLHLGVDTGKIVPVLFGSAQNGVGLQRLLTALIEMAPNPAEMPPPQVEDVKSGNMIELACKADSPLCAFVFKTTADPYVGKLTFFKIYSGVFHADSQVYNANKEREERVGQLYFMRGKNQEATSEIRAGDMGAVAKLQETATGDTLCDKAAPRRMKPIEFPEPIYMIAIAPKTKADEDRLGPALARLHDEDPTLHSRRDPETAQSLLLGMGDLHVESIIEKLKRKFGTEVGHEELRIPYRETITKKANAQGKFKRQSGGRGQYGDCWIEMEPLPRGSGIEFGERIVGGSIPKNYIAPIERGLREVAEKGIQAGYPATDFKAVVYDGSYHDVDSSDQAFRIAGSLAFQNASENAAPVVLEPLLEVEVDVPEAFTGDVMGDLNGRRGRIQGIDPLGKGRQLVRATVPMSEMVKYALDLRSITRGRGRFRTKPIGYEEVPFNIAQQLIEKHKKEKQAAEH